MNNRGRSINCIFRRVIAITLCFVLCFTMLPWLESTGGAVNAAEVISGSDYAPDVLANSVSNELSPSEELLTTAEYPALAEAKAIEGEFLMGSEIAGMNKYTFNYDDNWLFDSSNVFNYDMVKMSLRLSITTSHWSRMFDILEKMGYQNYAYNTTYAGVNNIGYYISSKNIKNADGKKISVIMVAVRGIGYSDEWGGNVWCGASGDHYGYTVASQTVYDRLMAYLESNKDSIPYEKKIWTFGYSRGGAVANLLGCKLNEDSQLETKYGIEQEDIFDYTYEAPQGVYGKKDYNNIVNIVNPIDLVPRLFMSEWGFYRAGNNYYLPSLNADGVKYLSYKKKMRKVYKQMLDYNGITDVTAESLTDATYSLQNNLDKLCHFLATEYESRENYSKNHEAEMVNSIKKSMSNGYDFVGLINGFSYAIPGLVSRLGIYWLLCPFDSAFVLDVLMKNYAEPHYPELIMSWVDSLGADELQARLDKIKYRRLLINRVTDVVVTDRFKNVVARIVNGVLDETLQKVTAYVDSNGQTVLVLPEDGEYTIEMSADNGGKISLVESEYNSETCSDEHVVKYDGVAVDNGEVLTFTTGEKEGQSISEDNLVSDGNGVIEPDLDLKGSAIKEWTVNVEIEGNGSASGSGVILDGEYTKFMAVPSVGEQFLGWYKNGRLVSKKLSFEMKINSDTTIAAKFTSSRNNLKFGLFWWLH